MKSLQITFLSLFLLITSASQADQLSEVLGDLVQVKEATNEILSDKDAHFYLFLNSLEWNDRKTYAKGKCRSGRNYKKTSRQSVASEVNALLIRANRYASDKGVADGENYGFRNLLAVYDALYGAKLTKCSEKTTPAYSDGQELTFIQVNGRLKFFYGYGLPD